MDQSRILIVEDNALVMHMVEAKLQAAGYEVVTAANSTQAIRLAQMVRPDLMILDLGLPEDEMFNALPDGFGVLGWLRRVYPDNAIPVIIHTENDSPKTQALAQQHEVHAVFRKGGDLKDLLTLIRQALDKAKAA